MENFFKYDLYRYYGSAGESIKNRILRPPYIDYLYFYRKVNSSSFGLLRFYYRLRLYRIALKTHIYMSWRVKVGKGFYIGHLGEVIINSSVIIGKNVNVTTGVTIGQENRGKRKGTPIIGDNVWIGTNAVIVGKIKIGSDVLIAPLTYINFDVPDHSIVIGNPARIIHKENATVGYINNTVE